MVMLKNPVKTVNIKSSEELLEARSILYGALSALYSDPDSEKFAMLLKPDFQKSILKACFQLDRKKGMNGTNLTKPLRGLLRRLDETKLGDIQIEYVDVFGHTLSKQTAPYELEHLKNSDVFFRTQKLADLNGFYRAFGVEVQSRERADHISTQTEFLSYLILKELLAIRKNLEEEQEVCQRAFIDFNQDHFYNWAKIFSKNLATRVDGEFYPAAGRFLSIFLDQEPS